MEKFRVITSYSIHYTKLYDDKYISISKTDPYGIITYVTKNFCESVGYSRDELIGKNHNLVRHPDTDPQIFKQMWETIKKGKVFQTALKNKTKDGNEVWFDLIIHPDYDIDNKLIGYTAIRRNITDKKIIEKFVITSYSIHYTKLYDLKLIILPLLPISQIL